jgi:hypothetical protein
MKSRIQESCTSVSVRVELREGLLYSTRFIHIVLRQYYGKQARRQEFMPIHINGDISLRIMRMKQGSMCWIYQECLDMRV